MALIKCPECGKDVSEQAVSCPNCGYPINNSNQTEEINPEKNKGALHGILYRENASTKGTWSSNNVKSGIFQNEQVKPAKKSIFGGLSCPKCRGHNIELLSNSANMKEFQRTGLNLNPLHPLTPFKTKTIKKEKTSMAKIGLGIMTGGTSLLFTGTKNKKHNEYFCKDCGNRWVGK